MQSDLRTKTPFLVLVILACAVVFLAVAAPERKIPPAFGPYIHLSTKELAEAKSFKSSDRVVGTYYFYWYDIGSKGHIINPENGSDGLTDHPASLTNFSYKSVAWHKKQLEDMSDAGIDTLLCTFWGAPSERNEKAALYWSYAGLGPLVQAREELLREGKRPPRIGLFYDTSTLQYNELGLHIDLTSDFGKRWFYATVRDFYSAIPPKHWAMMDGKPIVLMYAAVFAKKHDQEFVDFTKEEFKREFGCELYIAPQDSWQVKGDNVCAWGGAVEPKNPGIGEIGPGYNDSAVYGRKPLIKDREGGRFYDASWMNFLRRPSNFVMIETWSEFHEGTDICESKEYGRQYIELTRKYSDLFKKGWTPPWPQGAFTGAKSVAVQAVLPRTNEGVEILNAEDGHPVLEKRDGRDCWSAEPFSNAGTYVYFRVDDSFKWAPRMNVAVEVEYLDARRGELGIEFDGSDLSAPFRGAYTWSKKVPMQGDGKWKTARFELADARFTNGQNAGADFRVVAEVPGIAIRKVTVQRN